MTTRRRICAWCKTDLGPAPDNLMGPDGDTHGMCPRCRDKIAPIWAISWSTAHYGAGEGRTRYTLDEALAECDRLDAERCWTAGWPFNAYHRPRKTG